MAVIAIAGQPGCRVDQLAHLAAQRLQLELITESKLRQLVTDRIHDAERAYRAALLDLRHGLDVVRVLREVARLEELFAVIRWCDDWLPARRTLVARVEAQLAWFAEQAFLDPDASQDASGEDSSESNRKDPSAWFDRP